MSIPPPTLSSFRQLIALRYKWLGWMCGLGAILFFVITSWLHQSLFLKGLLSAFGWICILYLIYIYNHRQRMIYALGIDVGPSTSQFETYMDGQHQRWEKYAFARLILGTVLAGIMLALVVFSADQNLAQAVAGFFIAYIVGVMLKNWLQFYEQILLHDYRRLLRNQPSDMSD